jgi:hypothetical protein
MIAVMAHTAFPLKPRMSCPQNWVATSWMPPATFAAIVIANALGMMALGLSAMWSHLG